MPLVRRKGIGHKLVVILIQVFLTIAAAKVHNETSQWWSIIHHGSHPLLAISYMENAL